MRKAEMVEAMANKAGLTKKKSVEALDAILKLITDTAKEGDAVSLQPLGTFELVERPERVGRNPATSEKQVIPASRTIKFKPSRTLKDTLNS